MSYIPIKLDKDRNLLFGFGALQLFKSIHGESLMKIDFNSEYMEEVLPLIFFVGLKHEDDKLTIEETTRLLDLHLGVKGVAEYMPKIMAELNIDEDTGKNAQPARKAGKKK